jgi:type II secretory pathway component PulC
MKLIPKNSIYMFLFCFLILFFKVEFSLAYRSDQVYSDQVYIVDIIKDTPAYNSDLKVGDIVLKINNYDITANNYTTVIREIIRQLKAFSTVNTNSSVILVLMKLKISLNTFC